MKFWNGDRQNSYHAVDNTTTLCNKVGPTCDKYKKTAKNHLNYKGSFWLLVDVYFQTSEQWRFHEVQGNIKN